MKTFKLKSTILTCVLQLAVLLLGGGCEDRFPGKYALELPALPEAWATLLGAPHWRVEWVSPQGQMQIANVRHGERLEIEPPPDWTSPVSAWPYWPALQLDEKSFMPAGALFPFDADGEMIRLSWAAGVDSVFYWELAFANSSDLRLINYSRLPANFDWPRFRRLFSEGTLSTAVCENPWLVNWRSIAEQTVAGNFDRRKITPQAVELKTVDVPAATWYATSPFASPLVFNEGEPSIFPTLPGVNIWVSSEGMLKISGGVIRYIR